jgi:hypothetical protein
MRNFVWYVRRFSEAGGDGGIQHIFGPAVRRPIRGREEYAGGSARDALGITLALNGTSWRSPVIRLGPEANKIALTELPAGWIVHKQSFAQPWPFYLSEFPTKCVTA